jgi:hypothetical protein
VELVSTICVFAVMAIFYLTEIDSKTAAIKGSKFDETIFKKISLMSYSFDYLTCSVEKSDCLIHVHRFYYLLIFH